MGPSYWLPPVAWMAVILWLSSDSFSGEATRPLVESVIRWALAGLGEPAIRLIHEGIRTVAHLTEYGILAFLWYRALAHGRGLAATRSALLAFAIAAVWAGLDESRQLLTASRGGRLGDVVWDSLGAALALLSMRHGRRGLNVLTISLVWTAAIGGTLFLLLHLALGMSSGWLWATTPLAWLALWLRRRRGDAGGRQSAPRFSKAKYP
jgi:VanZ family protein